MMRRSRLMSDPASGATLCSASTASFKKSVNDSLSIPSPVIASSNATCFDFNVVITGQISAVINAILPENDMGIVPKIYRVSTSVHTAASNWRQSVAYSRYNLLKINNRREWLRSSLRTARFVKPAEIPLPAIGSGIFCLVLLQTSFKLLKANRYAI